jgi:4-amino-4-deoxy-L-arabinose transferase-like glycosyltransferase
MFRFKKKKLFTSTNVVLFILSCIAFVLRFYLIPQNLFFGPEQGRDFQVVKEIIVGHKVTLIGSKTDISGVFHGPIYYYLSTIPFLLSHGNPVVVLGFFILINSLTTILVYILGKELMSKRVGIIAAILYVFSFGVIIYSRWLSNPPLSIPFACLYFLSLHSFIKGKKSGLIFAALFLALLGQSEFLNYLFYGSMTLLYVIVFKKLFKKTGKLYLLSSFLLVVFLSSINYLLFDLRHEFLISKSILNLMSGSSGYYVPFGKSLALNFSVFSNSFSSFLTPGVPNLSIILIVVMSGFLIKLIRTRNAAAYMLATWIFVPLLVLSILRRDVMEQFYVSIAAGVIILAAIIVENVLKKNKLVGVLLLVLLVAINMYSWYQAVPNNQNIFFQSTQLDLKYIDELKVIDEIYKNANKKTFSFQSYTIPYWSQQGWEYLFWYYGGQKYGYQPIPFHAEKFFVIIQDDPSSRDTQDYWLRHVVSQWGTLKSQKKIGILTLQELDTSHK